MHNIYSHEIYSVLSPAVCITQFISTYFTAGFWVQTSKHFAGILKFSFNLVWLALRLMPVYVNVELFESAVHILNKLSYFSFQPMLHDWCNKVCGICYPVCGMRERERNVLFNDALNTFYLQLYGVRHMVKDHSDSEKGNPLQPHRLLLSINSKGSFICTIPQTG